MRASPRPPATRAPYKDTPPIYRSCPRCDKAKLWALRCRLSSVQANPARKSQVPLFLGAIGQDNPHRDGQSQTQSELKHVEHWATLVEISPDLAETNQVWSNITNHPNLGATRVGRNLANIGRTWSNPTQFRPKPDTFGRASPNIARSQSQTYRDRPILVEHSPTLAET